MGAFFNNLVVPGRAAAEVADAYRSLHAGPAYVAQIGADSVVFADMGAGPESPARALSAALDGTVLGVDVHDDDVLGCVLARRGEELTSGYVPDPAMVFGGLPVEVLDGLTPEQLAEFGLDEESTDAPDAAVLAAAFASDVEVVATVLAADEVFASERLCKLLAALGLPAVAGETGHRYIGYGDGPTFEPPLIEVG